MAEVIRELVSASPSLSISVRTAAAPFLFPEHPRVTVEPANVETRVVETPDSLRIDGEATVAGLRQLYTDRDRLVRAEAAVVRARGARLIVADMPFLAGYIAEAAGVPCVAIGNFTWSWVLRPCLDDALWRWMQEGYARMRSYYRLPFSHTDDLGIFPEVLPTSLVTRPIAVAPRTAKRKALLAFRGQLPVEAAHAAARAMPGWEIVTPDSAGPAQFNALLATADAVIGKLGYGLAGMCAAAKLRLLYAPREGFREDDIIAREAARYTVVRPIPREDLYAGRWPEHIDALMADPMPDRAIDPSGARVCARRLLKFVQ